MKLKSLLKSTLLLCALIAGSTSAWADVTWEKVTDYSSLSTSDTYVIAGNIKGGTTWYSLKNNQVTSATNLPHGSTLTIADNKITSTVSDNETWVLEATGTDGQFYIKSTKGAYYLQNTGSTGSIINSKNSTDNNNKWTIHTLKSNSQNTYSVTGLFNIGQSRSLTAYNTSDWRCYTSQNYANVSGAEVVLFKRVETVSSVETPTFSPAAGSYSSAQNVEISCATDGVTIYYTMGENPAVPTSTSTEYTGAISVIESTTIRAIAIKDGDESSVATATYTIVSFAHSGTEVDPYNVNDAHTAIDANIGNTGVYATGIVSQIVTAYNSNTGKITFNISDDGLVTSDQLQAYGCVGATGIDASEVQVGDVVVITGNLTKYNNTYEFGSGNELVSIQHPVIPTIYVTPTSLSGFTYLVGNGPSDAQTISVSGINLTENISLMASANYEISINETSGYTNNLTLTQTSGEVSATTVYVRLKSSLAVNTYDGTITLSSIGVTDKEVTLAGSVTNPFFSWDLSTDQTATASTTEMTWTSIFASMSIKKGSSTTNANNYYPGTSGQNYSSTRFYKNSSLNIAPAIGYSISKVVFTATTVGYANALQGSTWNNASATSQTASEPYTVIVNPTDGAKAITVTIGATCGFTAVKVYYGETSSGVISIAEACHNTDGYYGTFYTNRAYVMHEDLIGQSVSVDGDGKLTTNDEYSGGDVVPANTALLIYALASGDYTVNFTNELGTAPVSNDLRGTLTADEMTTGSDCKFYRLTMHNDTDLGFWWGAEGGAAFKPGANKAYLVVSNTSSAREGFTFGEDVTTGISEECRVKSEEFATAVMYDLQGRRVEKATKGLYIRNGRKVFVK